MSKQPCKDKKNRNDRCNHNVVRTADFFGRRDYEESTQFSCPLVKCPQQLVSTLRVSTS